MTRVSLLVVACALAAPAVAGPRQAGKVVRVERVRATAAVPRICDVQVDKTGNCFGPEPRVGDIITLVDDSGVVGEARVSEVTAFALGGRPNAGRGCDGLWSVKTDLLRGDLGSSLGRTVGVIDPAMHPRLGRMIPKDQLSAPTGRSEDTPAFGFDRDGDRVADIILLSQSACDGGGSMCIEEWVRTGGEMKRVHQVNLQTCGL